jgi:hypothetical protein
MGRDRRQRRRRAAVIGGAAVAAKKHHDSKEAQQQEEAAAAQQPAPAALAKLLASGELDAVWMPDRETWVMRRRLARPGPAGLGTLPGEEPDRSGMAGFRWSQRPQVAICPRR